MSNYPTSLDHQHPINKNAGGVLIQRSMGEITIIPQNEATFPLGSRVFFQHFQKSPGSPDSQFIASIFSHLGGWSWRTAKSSGKFLTKKNHGFCVYSGDMLYSNNDVSLLTDSPTVYIGWKFRLHHDGFLSRVNGAEMEANKHFWHA